MSYRQYPPEYYEPSSRGPCHVCKVDEEDHGHVWKFTTYRLNIFCGLNGCAFTRSEHDDHEYEPCEPVRDDA